MCGIIGQVNNRRAIDHDSFVRMRDTLTHRGPDDAGVNFFNNDAIALGHRRLSFLDLSEAGRQPMCNEDETIWIVLNGEIYNYIELREELVKRHHIFKTQTDTEVIIHGYEEWGLSVLDRLKGMFAFGLLDLKKSKLFLARDRFGIKPLYYYRDNDQFIFASELKAIVENKEVKRELDMSSFADYFVYRYIPSPKTIWKNICKIPPAHYLVYDLVEKTLSETEYWKISFANERADEQHLVTEVGAMLSQSVAIHARSDVPVGSFLSGGYDSSAIVYYLTKQHYLPQTFSIGFKDWGKSEHRYAQIVADHLGVPLSSVIVDNDNLDLLDIMPDVYDEPIADISIIPTWLVSNNAVKKVKTVMSGEGADELFGGYIWQKDFFSQQQQISILQRIFNKLSGKQSIDTIQFYSNAMAMGKFDAAELEKMLAPEFHSSIAKDTDWFYRKNFDSTLAPLQSIQQMDIKCFMGELVLTKIDRASMANSLEVRVPFLDHELFEKVLSVREHNYFKHNTTKYLLYENIKQYLPNEILTRPKQGFVGPDSFYMNIQWYKTILDESDLIRDGIIRRDYYLQLLRNSDYWRLWKLAVMQKWYKQWMN